MPTQAEMPQRATAPQVPSTSIEAPSDAIRKPGLQRAITNPSHQRSAFSRCRSSIEASAIGAPPFTAGELCLARHRLPCLYAPRPRHRGSCSRDCPATFRSHRAQLSLPVRQDGPGQHLLPSPGPVGAAKRALTMRKVRGALITIRCDCGGVGYVPYGERWECGTCHRRWNTGQIPAEEYWGIMRDMRRLRITVIFTALALVVPVVALVPLAGARIMILLPVIMGFWFIFYMPRWRRRVREQARSLRRWNLTPE